MIAASPWNFGLPSMRLEGRPHVFEALRRLADHHPPRPARMFDAGRSCTVARNHGPDGSRAGERFDFRLNAGPPVGSLPRTQTRDDVCFMACLT